MTPQEDESFVAKLAALLGKETEDVSQMIGNLSIDELMAVISATEEGDSEKVSELMADQLQDTDSSDFKPSTEQSPEKSSNDFKPNEEPVVDEDVENIKEYTVGEKLKYKGHDAIVKIPKGPSGTIGLMIDGDLKMIKKSKLDNDLTESTGFDLSRLRQLSGLQNLFSAGNTPEEEQPSMNSFCDVVSAGQVAMPDEDCVESPAIKVMAAFDTILDNICAVSIGDAKNIRAKIAEISAKLYESRKLKN